MEPKRRQNFPPVQVRDTHGNNIDFHINNGETSEVDVVMDGDYTFTQKIQPSGFFIKPLVAGEITVQLWGQADDETYVFSTEEVDAYIGRPFEEKIKKIAQTGTTVNRIKVVW